MIKGVVADGVFVAGMALASGGVFLIYVPAGVIISGVCLMALGILSVRR